MSIPYQHSRKNFIAKLLGIGVTAGLLSRVAAFARQPGDTPPAGAPRTTRKPPFAIRTDARCIARTDAV